MSNEYTLAADIEAALRKAKTEAILAAMPEDVYETGDVLVFTRKFNADGPTYTYAAVKAAGSWYVTGKDNAAAKTWAQLLAGVYSRGLEGVTMYETALHEIVLGG